MASGYEKVYEDSYLPIKYVYKKADNYHSNKLVIIFSALGPKPVYNYMKTLEGIDVNQLFILDDYGNRGCYYLGKYPDFLVEKSVVSLIEHILMENSIDKANVLCGGSSKGATAALYFALRCQLGHVVIAEPQIKIAKYLEDYEAFDVLDYIVGNVNEKAGEIGKNKINNILLELIEKEKFWPSVLIHAGINTYYYKEHIEEFISLLKLIDKNVKLDLKNYSNHSDLIKYYPDLLINEILEKFTDIKEHLYIKKIDVDADNNKFRLSIDGDNFEETAWYVYKDNVKVFTQWYGQENYFEYTADASGKYSFVAFARDSDNNKLAKKTGWFEISSIL